MLKVSPIFSIANLNSSVIGLPYLFQKLLKLFCKSTNIFPARFTTGSVLFITVVTQFPIVEITVVVMLVSYVKISIITGKVSFMKVDTAGAKESKETLNAPYLTTW